MNSTARFSIELLKAGLSKAGYSFETKILGGVKHTLFTSKAGNTWLTSNIRVSYPFNNSSARNICTNKRIAYDLVQNLGVSIPLTVCIDAGQTLQGARLKTLMAEAPLIVKPDNASLSHGLTMQIMNEKQLKRAIQVARTFSSKILVQKQVSSEEIRFVAIDGKITAAILRQTPRVIGDGVHTVRELIKIENTERKQLKMPYITYPQLKKPLIDLDAINLSDIPGVGEMVELGRSTMVRGGASMYNVLEDVHESYVRTAQQLATKLGNGFTAVDMFIDNYRQPQAKTNYAFNEFNSSPVLVLFYSCRDGKHYDAVGDLVRLIDQNLRHTVATDRIILGNFEYVSLPDLGLTNLVAKVDTGAYSGALDCLKIEPIKVGTKQTPGIRFCLAGKPENPIETTDFVRRYVRSATGHRVERYLINTSITLKGTTYPITIGLSDRSKLTYPILLGRRFLRANNMLVDVSINEELDREREFLS